MSVEKEVRDLKLLMRSIEKAVLKGTMPDQPVLFELDDGSEDIERFKRDYNCTPAEALERGATHIVLRINFSNPANIQPREAYARVADPNYVSRLVKPPAVDGEYNPADEPVTISDPLVEALLRQARDNAQSQDAARKEDSGR